MASTLRDASLPLSTDHDGENGDDGVDANDDDDDGARLAAECGANVLLDLWALGELRLAVRARCDAVVSLPTGGVSERVHTRCACAT